MKWLPVAVGAEGRDLGGEAAGEPSMIPKPIDLGVTELSRGDPALPGAKVISEK